MPQPLIDEAVFLGIWTMAPAARRPKLLSAFVGDIDRYARALAEAADADDAAACREAAHALKGAAATIGAAALTQAVNEWREAMEAGDNDAEPVVDCAQDTIDALAVMAARHTG